MWVFFLGINLKGCLFVNLKWKFIFSHLVGYIEFGFKSTIHGFFFYFYLFIIFFRQFLSILSMVEWRKSVRQLFYHPKAQQIQTNLYYCQLNGSSINTNTKAINAFIGMKIIIMDVVKLPAVMDYWAEDTRYDKIADIMSVTSFKSLSRMLHFQDKTTSASNEDVLFKIRLVLNPMKTKRIRIVHTNIICCRNRFPYISLPVMFGLWCCWKECFEIILTESNYRKIDVI